MNVSSGDEGLLERGRKWINEHQAVTIGVACTCVLVFVIVVVIPWLFGGGGSPTERKAWYYDLNSGELFVGSADEVGPIKGPSNQMFTLPNGTQMLPGVRAYIFKCEGCDDVTVNDIAWLQTTSPQLRAAFADDRKAPPAKSKSGKGPLDIKRKGFGGDTVMNMMVALPSDVNKWYTTSSDEYRKWVEQARRECERGGKPQGCDPP